jgi:polar amino acid transport system substrate-binding protein
MRYLFLFLFTFNILFASTSNKINFTDEELAYLKNKQVIKMCVDPSWMPFESIKDDKHIGMVAEVYEHFGRNINIPIELLITSTWSESLDSVRVRRCDILSAAVETKERKKYLNFSEPYLIFPQVVVTKEKEEFIENIINIKDKKIGVVKDSGIAEILRNKYPTMNFIDIKNVTQGLYKVSSGELYGFVNTSATLSYAIAKNGLTNLKVASRVGVDYFIKVAVRNDDQILLDIFNKLIKNINQEHIETITNKWIQVKLDKQVDYTLLYQALGIFLLILSIVLFFIIKQNRLKKLIEEQKQVFEDIFEKSTDPIFLMKDGKVVDCNKATIKILGLQSKDEFINLRPASISPKYQPDNELSIEKANRMLQIAIEKGTNHFEWLHTKSNGEEFWIDAVLTKININNEDIIHVLWRDIDKRKKIESELQSQKEQLDTIFSHIPIPVLIVSKISKDIIFANEYAAKTYQIKLNSLIGQKIDTLYENQEQKNTILSCINDNDILTNYETHYKLKDNSLIDLLLSLIPINFDGFEANLLVVTDVTYLKKIQEELKQETLKATNANNIKSEFLAKMSHEIRTPMNAVLGMLYLIQKTSLTTIQDSYISKANSAANSLLSIIDDILDFSKIEAGKLSIENKEFNFNDMVHETMDIMSFKAQEKGCELLAYYDSTIPSVIKSDKIRIGQILSNLINNAIKFTGDGEVVVSSKLIKQDKNIVTIMFCVKDSGIGITKENQEKLFKDFSQGDNSVTRKFGGTGLGLAISKKLAALLGGKIWIEESKFGVGSTFCFTIKCEASTSIPQKQYVFPQEFNNIQTLIIDDNFMACDILKSMLKSFGFDVDIVYNGEDGYNAIANSDKTYDLVFLDYKMPKLNGIQTYTKIKTMIHKSVPKTIMITAYSQDDILEQITQLGIENYLIKPASPSTLYNTIIEVLNPSLEQNIENITKNNSINLTGIKILLAEDNELNQDFAKELLRSVNIAVDIAFDGEEAVDMIKSKAYDAILMDIQMPNMDGLSATKIIRDMKDDPYFQDIPIIALSANALAGDRQKSIEAGMNEHISKPIIPNELFDTLKKFLKDFTPVPIEQNEDTNSEITCLDNGVLDVNEALKRMGGNEIAYIKLLKQFSFKYKDVFLTIEQLSQDGNNKELKNKIHEIKGIAGNISANKLFTTLSKIERILKIKDIPPYSIYDELNSDLEDIFSEISDLSIQKSASKKFDKDKVIILLDTILANLENDIVICENSLEELTPYLEKDYTSFSDSLSQALNEFDIDEAFTLIEDFLEELKNG